MDSTNKSEKHRSPAMMRNTRPDSVLALCPGIPTSKLGQKDVALVVIGCVMDGRESYGVDVI